MIHAVVLIAAVFVGSMLLLCVGSFLRGSTPREAAAPVVRSGSEQMVEAWRQRYVDGDMDVAEFEAGVWRAMTGASDAVTIARAEGIAGSRPQPDEWVKLAHERRMTEFFGASQR